MRWSWHGWVAAIVGVLVMTGVAAGASAQTVDELLAMNLQSRGGLERLHGVSTIRMAGRITGGGQDMKVTTSMKRPNLVKQEMSGQGITIIQAFDGTRAWMVNPMIGAREPVELPAAQADQLKQNADFDGPLVDYKAKGNKVELLGTETLDGAKVFRLRVTKKGGQSQTFWLDVDTGLERKMAAEVAQGGQTVTIEQVMSNFKTVSGLTVPFSVETLANGQRAMLLTLESVEINAPIDDSVFRMPGRQ